MYAVRIGSKAGEKGVFNFPSQPALINEKICGIRMVNAITGLESIYDLGVKGSNYNADLSYFFTLVDSDNKTFAENVPASLFGYASYSYFNRFKPRKLNYSKCFVKYFDSNLVDTELYLNFLISDE